MTFNALAHSHVNEADMSCGRFHSQFANTKAMEMLGYKTSAELIGQNVRMIMPEPHHSNHDSKSPFMCLCALHLQQVCALAKFFACVCVHARVRVLTSVYFVTDYLKNFIRTGVAKIIGRPRDLIAMCNDGSLLPIKLAISEQVCVACVCVRCFIVLCVAEVLDAARPHCLCRFVCNSGVRAVSVYFPWL